MDQNQKMDQQGTQQVPPVYVANVLLTTKGKGKKARQTLVFLVLRKRNVVPKAMTIRYWTVDSTSQNEKGTMREFIYNKRMNEESCLIRFQLPKGMTVTHCSAYISSILTDEGKIDLEPINRSAKSGQIMDMLRSTATTDVDVNLHDQPKRMSAHSEEQKRSFRRGALTVVGCILLAAVLAGGSVLLYKTLERNTYDRTITAAQVPYEAGLRVEVEELLEKYLSRNGIYKRERAEMTEIADRLCTEGRYNEAYGIAKDTMFASILQDVCTRAADAALGERDYKTASLYAQGAPEPFVEKIISSAIENGYDPETRTVDESAGKVIATFGTTADRDALLLRTAKYDLDKNNRSAVLAVAGIMSENGTKDLAALVEEIGRKAIEEGDLDKAKTYLIEYGFLGQLDGLAASLYHAYLNEEEYTLAAQLAGSYAYDFFTNTTVEPDDMRVRLMLKSTYPRLSEMQKRAYHAEPLAVSNRLTVVNNDSVSYSEHGITRSVSNIVSVASGDFFTVLLHRDGRAEMLTRLVSCPSEIYTVGKDDTQTMSLPTGGIVAVAAGEKHLVCLMSDGTVQTTGSNAYGQCDTAGWKDIVAVAAGKRFTVGLKSDGTVVSCGSNACGQCELSGYRNVVDVRACWQSTVLLFRDGSVKIVGEHSMGLSAADSWKNIRKIRAGGTSVMAMTADGTVIQCGSPAVDPDVLTDVMDFAVGDAGIVVRKTGGAIVTTGDIKPQY